MSQRGLLVVLIALGCLLVTGCAGSPSFAAAPDGAAPRPIAPALPALTRTPSGIFITTRVYSPETPTGPAATLQADATAVIVQGRVYDAGRGQRLNNATLEWQFLALDRQRYNGQLQISADGLYRLELPARNEDEVIITARAPGYLPSMARLLGKQLSQYGSRLDFGLVKVDGPLPTLPGSLGTIQLRGIVYNSARGFKDPIANARVTIVDRSLVQPQARVDATTGITGTFEVPVPLHTSDQIDLTITASGYQTVTLSRSAAELAGKPQLAIGMNPAPQQ